LENAATIRDILVGRGGPPRDIVIANAAAALVAANVATNFLEGARLATAALTSGAAKEKLAALVDFTQQPW
jgi:anthranilate phosphoribosyltransferase